MTKRTYEAQPLSQALKTLNPNHKESVKVNKKYYNEYKASKYTTIGAVYPYLNSTAFKLTLKRYKLYVSKYNKLVKDENLSIVEHNNIVNNYYAKNDVELAYKHISSNFKIKYKKLDSIQYNLKVDETNLKLRKMLILKRKMQRVSVQAEKVFVASLYQYNKTFRRINKANEALNEKAFRGLPKLDFNSGEIKALKENGYHLVDFCTKTIRRHRKRLEEAHIFRDYTFHGQERGIKLHINNQILVVYDGFEKKITHLENQLINQKERTLCTDNNIITIIKIKENNEKGFSLSLKFFSFLLQEHELASLLKRNLESEIKAINQLKKSLKEDELNNSNKNMIEKDFPAEKISLNLPKNSNDFKRYLINIDLLSNQLQQGVYFDAPEIQNGAIMFEAMNGSLTQLEFQRVLINYFMMKMSCIYNKPENPKVVAKFGSWKEAIRNFERLFLVNRNKTLKSKEQMATIFIKVFLYAIEQSIKYSKDNPEFNQLYPNMYFYVNNGDVKDRGFFYFARNEYQKMLDELTADQIKEQKRKDDLITNKNNTQYKASALIRLQRQVRLYLNEKKTLEQLVDYAFKKHTKELYDKLSIIINEEKQKAVEPQREVA